MKLNNIKCDANTKDLTNKGWTKTNKVGYNSKDNSKFEKTTLDCDSGMVYFYKEKQVLSQKKYSCKNNTCVEDTNGSYSEPTCGGACKKKVVNVTPCTYPSTNFKSTTEGNEFRKFMHDNFKSYATSIKLDLTGPKDNCNYVRKAYATVPDGYALSYGEMFLKSKTNPNWKENFKKENYDEFKQKEESEGKYTSQLSMWTDLINKERVPRGGEVKKLKGGGAWYIIKAQTDGTIVPMTGTETQSINSLIEPLKSGNFMYVAWLPPSDINKQPITGEVADLKVKQNVNGEDYVGAEKRQGTTWKAFDAGTTFEDDLKESIIKNILGLITEDDTKPKVNINSFMTGPTSSSSSSQTSGNITNMMSSNNVSVTQPNLSTSTSINIKAEVEKVMAPKLASAKEMLVSLIDYSQKNGGIVKGKKVEEFKKIQNELNGINAKDICDESNLSNLRNKMSNAKSMMNQYDSFFDNTEKEMINKLISLVSTVESDCKSLLSRVSGSNTSTSLSSSTPSSQTQDEPGCISDISKLHPDQLKSISSFTQSNPSYSLEFTSTGTHSSIKLKELRWSKKYGVGTEEGNLVVPQPPDYPQYSPLCNNLRIYKRSDIQGKTPDQVAALEEFFVDENLNMTVDEGKFGASELRFKVGALVPNYKLQEKGLESFSDMPVYITDIEGVANPSTDQCRKAIKQLDACIGGSRGGGLVACSNLKSIVTNKLTAYYCVKEVRGEGKFWNRIGLGKEVANVTSDRSDKFGISKMIAIKESRLEQTIKDILLESIRRKNEDSLSNTIKSHLRKHLM